MSARPPEGSSTEATWQSLSSRFSELRGLIDNMRLETQQEAVGRRTDDGKRWEETSPCWYDPGIGMKVRAWSLISYIDAIDQENLRERIRNAQILIQTLEERLAAEDLSVQTMWIWGQFCSLLGGLELVYFSEPDVGHLRSAIAGGRARSAEPHQRWFAHYFLRIYKRGQRAAAEEAVERLINAIIDERVAVPGKSNVPWFERYLQLALDNHDPNYAKLRDAYREHQLSVKTMRRLVQLGSDGIPPVDLQFPDP